MGRKKHPSAVKSVKESMVQPKAKTARAATVETETSPETSCELMRNGQPPVLPSLRLAPGVELAYMDDVSKWASSPFLVPFLCGLHFVR
jgi:hypothetical protein